MPTQTVSPSMELIDGFALWLRASGRRPTPSDRILRTARQYLAHEGGDAPFERQSVIAFLAAKSAEVKRVSLRNYYDGVHLLCTYALCEGLADRDPMLGLARPRVPLAETERDAAPITEAMQRAALAVCPAWRTQGLRDQAILMLLWDTPLRASELCGLLATDIDWEMLEVHVRDGKDGVRYEAPFTPQTGLAVQRYRRRVDHALLFGSLTVHALEQMLRRVSARAGISPHLYPHRYRHAYRDRMRALGLDDADISALMGHTTVRSTQGYARRAARQRAKVRLRERLSA